MMFDQLNIWSKVALLVHHKLNPLTWQEVNRKQHEQPMIVDVHVEISDQRWL